MARDRDAKMVLRAGFCHGPGSFRHADVTGDLRIRRRCASRDPSERVPDALLECSAANIEGKIQTDPWRFNEANNPRNQGFVLMICADKTRLWETILKAARERVRIISEKDCGDSFLARGNQNGAQTGLANRKLDLL